MIYVYIVRFFKSQRCWNEEYYIVVTSPTELSEEDTLTLAADAARKDNKEFDKYHWGSYIDEQFSVATDTTTSFIAHYNEWDS